MTNSSFISQEEFFKTKTGFLEILGMLATAIFIVEQVLGFYWSQGMAPKFNWRPEQIHPSHWYAPFVSTAIFSVITYCCGRKKWPTIYMKIASLLQIGVVIYVNLLMRYLWQLNGLYE